jgi:hypothetical protein
MNILGFHIRMRWFIGFILAYILVNAVVSTALQKNQVNYASIVVIGDNDPIDPPVPDTLPHRLYLRLTDSIAAARRAINKENVSWTGAEFFAVYKESERQLQGLQLHGWTLNPPYPATGESAVFFVRNGRGFVRHTDVLERRVEHANFKATDTPVEFLYSSLDESIRIPLQSGYAVVSFLGYFSIIAVVVGMLLLFGQWVNFLVDIGRGRPFSDRNIFRLKILALACLLIPIGRILIHLLLRLICSSYFTVPLYLKTHIWQQNTTILLASLFFFLLLKAFLRGKKMQEEQEYTI